MGINELFASGTYFELQILRELKREFPECVVFHDRIIYSNYLKAYTQIDGIVIARNFVGVIEAKNWNGWIEGGYDDAYWYGKSRSNNLMKVHNIVYQNKIHVRCLCNEIRNLGLNPPEFLNLVCVPNGTKVKTDCTEVYNLDRLLAYLKGYSRAGKINVDGMSSVIERVTKVNNNE